MSMKIGGYELWITCQLTGNIQNADIGLPTFLNICENSYIFLQIFTRKGALKALMCAGFTRK